MNKKRPQNLEIPKNPHSLFSRQTKTPRLADNFEANGEKNKQFSLGNSPSVSSPRKRWKMGQKKVSQVEQIHQQLNFYIDNLDEKVSKYIQHHESQFLVAYRNHVKRIDEEMRDLKSKNEKNTTSSISHTDRIQSLEKQIILFREESLKVFNKLKDKQKLIKSVQHKVKQLEKQNMQLVQAIKELKREKKKFALNNSKSQFESRQESSVFLGKETQKQASEQEAIRPFTTAFNTKRLLRLSNQAKIIRQNENFGQTKQKEDSDFHSCLSNIVKITECNQQETIDGIKRQLRQYIKNNEVSRQWERKVMTPNISSQKQYSTRVRAQSHLNQLQQYFYACIQNVRKDIVRRKGLKSLNFYTQNGKIGLEDFKKMDFFRLLQLLFSNETILVKLFHNLFSNEVK